MSKWIAEFELEDGDIMPEHMDLEYKGVRIDFHCKPQEPTTKNDLGVDAISRSDVLKLMQDNWHTHNGDWAMQESMDDIRALPSVTPQEPKTGHWYRQTNDYVDYYECSECGMAMGLYDVKSYCPNCGSRNEVEE